MRSAQPLHALSDGMECIGLKWNEKKCAVAYVRRGRMDESAGSMKIDDLKPIRSLGEDSTYTFLGMLESVKQKNILALDNAAGSYLQRLSIIWSSPLSDQYKVVASNQHALPLLTYLMWTQVWPLADLQQFDRGARKIVTENGGNHPQGSSEMWWAERDEIG